MNRRDRILTALDAFVEQRPGIDPRDYGDSNSAYRCDARRATQSRTHYYRIRREVEHTPSISGDDLIKASLSAFSGRLSITDNGETSLDYCTGQYWPTEYRSAACAVLASALWAYHRAHCPVEYDPDAPDSASPGAWMRRYFRNAFGQGIQRAWFD